MRLQDYPPMELFPVESLPTGPEWVYEPKWNGWRMTAGVDASARKIEMRSKSGNSYTHAYPAIESELMSIFDEHHVVLDAELVAFDYDHNQNPAIIRSRGVEPVYVLFDLMFLDGRELLKTAFATRRALLETLTEDKLETGAVFLTPQFDAETLSFEAIKKHRFEGVVAKKLDSEYILSLPRRRKSKNWRKQRFTD